LQARHITAESPPRSAARRSGGFTLVELLVAMTTLGILAAIAAPSFNNAILGSKLTGFTNSFIASAQLARSEAIKRNGNVVVCRSGDHVSCAGTGTWQQGWIVFHDANKDGAVDSGETVIRVQQALSTDYHFSGDSYSLAFQPTGGIPALVTLSLCRAAPDPGSQERTLKISATGRTSAETTRNGSCP
jgi:type IV fimbrial biogenesis protein FimT